MKWDWSTFVISMAAITAAVVIVIPVVDRVKDAVLDMYDAGTAGAGGEPE